MLFDDLAEFCDGFLQRQFERQFFCDNFSLAFFSVKFSLIFFQRPAALLPDICVVDAEFGSTALGTKPARRKPHCRI